MYTQCYSVLFQNNLPNDVSSSTSPKCTLATLSACVINFFTHYESTQGVSAAKRCFVYAPPTPPDLWHWVLEFNYDGGARTSEPRTDFGTAGDTDPEARQQTKSFARDGSAHSAQMQPTNQWTIQKTKTDKLEKLTNRTGLLDRKNRKQTLLRLVAAAGTSNATFCLSSVVRN